MISSASPLIKKVAVLGSTGSIGVNTLDVISRIPGGLRAVGLSARSNVKALAGQVRRHRPSMVSLFDPEASRELRRAVNGGCRHLPHGVEGLVEMASHPDVDIVLTSLVGGVGFAPLVAAVRAGKTVALANKEPMVMAGAQFMREARRWEAKIIPVDSEPSAIFQCVQGQKSPIRKIILTASGGAFYRRKGSLRGVTPAEALKHPTWKMGPKITIDCATLMNKGFESIEIMNLFGLRADQIEIVIHPQSIIHSAVEFADGSVLAQLSLPDMRLPIQYALTYPGRLKSPVKPLDLFELKALTFDRPDFRRFPCLELAGEAARQGGGLPVVLSAADEVAVDAFAADRIAFTDIPLVIEKTMRAFKGGSRLPGFSEVVEIDAWARQRAEELCRRF